MNLFKVHILKLISRFILKRKLPMHSAFTTSLRKIFVPFDADFYINGAHPLVNGYTLTENKNYKFLRIQDTVIGPSDKVNFAINNFCEELMQICNTRQMDNAAIWQIIYKFMLSRRPDIQQRLPDRDTLTFHHTVPYSINCSNFVLHIETVSQIFQPYISQGKAHPIPLCEDVLFYFIKLLLESPHCKAVFTNLHFTVDQLATIFKSDKINSKTYFVPPSCRIDLAKMGSFLAKRKNKEKKQVRILFTNSFHDNPESFYLRGGMEIVNFMLGPGSKLNNLSLTIRSSVPADLKNSPRWQKIKESNKIKWITDYLTEHELMTLYAESDIFFLNSNALHSLSILRAMSHGLTCIVSDAPGVEEYVKHGFNGIEIKGKRDLICKMDSSSGWIYDDYEFFLQNKWQESTSGLKIEELLTKICLDPSVLDYFSDNAIATIRKSFTEESSNQHFFNMLDKINS